MQSQFMIKNFFKSKAVEVTLIYPNNNRSIYYALPCNDNPNYVEIKDRRYSIDTSKEYFTISKKRILCFTYLVDQVHTINFDDGKTPEFTSDEVSAAMNNKLAKELNKATAKGNDMNWAMIAALVAVVTLIYVYSKLGGF